MCSKERCVRALDRTVVWSGVSAKMHPIYTASRAQDPLYHIIIIIRHTSIHHLSIDEFCDALRKRVVN